VFLYKYYIYAMGCLFYLYFFIFYILRRHRKQQLTVALRLFARFGYDEGAAGHITVRDPAEPDTFWVIIIFTTFVLDMVAL
jgi:hypothetical protein